MECKWKDHFLLPQRKFPRENGISWKVVQTSQTEFPNENACSICLFLLVRGLLAWIVFDHETTKLIKDGFAEHVGFWRLIWLFFCLTSVLVILRHNTVSNLSKIRFV